MSNIDSKVNSISGFVIFGAEYLSDVVSSGTAVTIPAGSLLKRDGANLVVSENDDEHIAVLPVDVVFTAAGTKSMKVLTAGKVDRSKLSANGSALNVADIDALRSFGITAITRQQLSELDNI